MRRDASGTRRFCQQPTVAVLAVWRERRAMDIGSRLKMARDWVGYTQDELAQKANVKKDQISRWERGTPVRDVDAMGRIADALLINLDWLFGRTEEEPQPEGLRVAFNVLKPSSDVRAWCVEMRSHGDVDAAEWMRRITEKKRGVSDAVMLAEYEATSAAQSRGDALNVPRRRNA